MDSAKAAEAARQQANSRRTAVPVAPLGDGLDSSEQADTAVAAAPPRNGMSKTGDPRVRAEFHIDDEKCRVIRVDMTPMNGSSGHQPAHTDGEQPDEAIAHYDIDGQKYALFMPATVRARRALRNEAAAAAKTNFLRRLTRRELEIVQLICAGRVNQQVAEALGISEFTVGAHLKYIHLKLGVRARGELIFRCAQALARAQSNGSGNGA